MLYCPKCQRKYEARSRRFCDNCGTRLAAAPNSESRAKIKGGIFTNLLGKTQPFNQTDEKLASTPKFTPLVKKINNDFPTLGEAKIGEKEKFETSLIAPKETKSKEEQNSKPITRLIKPFEIATGTAEIGNREINPLGRTAFDANRPETFIGETIKSRYSITKVLGQDENCSSYLAEDRLAQNKNVIIRIFTARNIVESSSKAILLEELVSLSHIIHPNIAGIIDSGEMPEGNSFIISEFNEGKTVKDMLNRTGQFNPMRTARIIRQAGYGLSEAHQNSVLHRNLNPDSIVLDISEAGIEQVKVTGFGSMSDAITKDNIAYKSPEQLDGKTANYASDIYSLGVIAYQMLTNRLPFNTSSVEVLRKAQKEGLVVYPTNLRLDVPPLVDEILSKALAENPTERYAKASDFGNAFFNALTTSAPWENSESTPETEKKVEDRQFITIPPLKTPSEFEDSASEEAKAEIFPDFDDSQEKQELEEKIEATTELEIVDELDEKEDELPWEKRSPETVWEKSPHWLMLGIFALGMLVLAGVWYFILNIPKSNNPELGTQTGLNNQIQNNQTNDVFPTIETPFPKNEEIEVPPVAREITPPENSKYFENSKEGLQGDLAKNFLGFSLYYPNDWTKTESRADYLDISKRSPDNLPIKQILITRYESRGTFNQDLPNFPKLVEKSNKDLKASLPNYKVISEGETTIQDGRWKAYEVKFENSGKISKNGELTLWGRRLWIPVQRPGTKSGFVITVVATSLSPNIGNIDELLSDEELNQILYTFEASTNS